MKIGFLRAQLIITFLILFPLITNGQVLVSNILNSNVYWGPDNIKGNKNYLSPIYIETLKIARQRLKLLYKK